MKPVKITYTFIQQYKKRHKKDLACAHCFKPLKSGQEASRTSSGRRYYCKDCALNIEI